MIGIVKVSRRLLAYGEKSWTFVYVLYTRTNLRTSRFSQRFSIRFLPNFQDMLRPISRTYPVNMKKFYRAKVDISLETQGNVN